MTAPFVHAIGDHHPNVDEHAFIAPGAHILGRVDIAAHSSVWYSTVLRGDAEHISIGTRSNVQDGCVVHADPGFATTVGENVTVGHRAVLHGCTIENTALIGMGAILLNGSHIGSGSLIAAGAVVLEGTEIPPGSLVAGTPGKVRRELTDEERSHLALSADQYVALAEQHRRDLGR